MTRITHSRSVWWLAAALIATALPLSVNAQQDYPNRPVRLIVVAGEGGTTDRLARLLSASLTTSFKQQVIVDPRPGGSGVIAAETTARAKPDGYTLLLTYHAHTINAAKNDKLPYHVVNDFTPITQLVAAGSLLTVNAASPPRTLKEFITWTRSQKRPLNAGVPGSGSGGYLAAEMFARMAGVNAQSINHAGSGKALIGLMGGEYDYAFTGIQGALAQVRTGRLRAIAVTTPKRMKALPDLPAMAEELPGFDVSGWWGVLAPAKLPKQLQVRLHDEFVKALLTPEMRATIEADGAEPVGNSPEEFRKVLLADLQKWPKVIKSNPGAK
jgi:tripartite-type tricarboxylate transporter receptor subunit TctC